MLMGFLMKDKKIEGPCIWKVSYGRSLVGEKNLRKVAGSQLLDGAGCFSLIVTCWFDMENFHYDTAVAILGVYYGNYYAIQNVLILNILSIYLVLICFKAYSCSSVIICNPTW